MQKIIQAKQVSSWNRTSGKPIMEQNNQQDENSHFFKRLQRKEENLK